MNWTPRRFESWPWWPLESARWHSRVSIAIHRPKHFWPNRQSPVPIVIANRFAADLQRSQQGTPWTTVFPGFAESRNALCRTMSPSCGIRNTQRSMKAFPQADLANCCKPNAAAPKASRINQPWLSKIKRVVNRIWVMAVAPYHSPPSIKKLLEARDNKQHQKDRDQNTSHNQKCWIGQGRSNASLQLGLSF